MSAALAIVGVLVSLAGLMAGIRIVQTRRAVSPELARKLVHTGMGTLCLGFPWIFAAPGPVWLLAALAAGALLAVRAMPPLRRQLGPVLGGVERTSLGEIYFPFAVALVFHLANGDAAAFCAPIAILTYADTAGALVGQHWGRHRYPAVESTKSVEGSLAVLLVTWVAATVLLVGLDGTPVLRALLVGLIMGLFAALVEAVSWRGIDNLLLPVVAFAQLRVYTALGVHDLVIRTIVMLALVGFMLAWRRRLLDFSGRLGAGLALYVFWSLGGLPWLVAPLALLASYTRLMPTVPGGVERHRLAAVICIASAGILWAVANARYPAPVWLWLFTLGFAAHQAVIAAVRFAQSRPHWRRWQWWAVAVVQAVGVHALAFLLVNGTGVISVRDGLLGGAAVAIALAGFMAWDRQLADPGDLEARWWRQGTTAVLASLAGFVVLRV